MNKINEPGGALSLILDEIEMMARLALPPTGIADYVKWSPDQVCNICKIDVPALVKALRRAIQYISVSGIPETRKEVLADITAILNQGRWRALPDPEASKSSNAAGVSSPKSSERSESNNEGSTSSESKVEEPPTVQISSSSPATVREQMEGRGRCAECNRDGLPEHAYCWQCGKLIVPSGIVEQPKRETDLGEKRREN